MEKQYTLLGADGRPYQSATPGIYGGNRRSKLYGRLDCPAALRAIARGGYATYRVFFADEQTALRAGYRPCAVCLPGKYAAWKANRLSALAPSNIRGTSSTRKSRCAGRCRGPPGRL
jgi:methylphosphotriester-DNA--protein-cysteine methyltransferase